MMWTIAEILIAICVVGLVVIGYVRRKNLQREHDAWRKWDEAQRRRDRQ